MDLKTAEQILSKVRQDYTAIAGEFSATRFSVCEEVTLLEGLVQSGMKVLDVGCGNGRLYALLQDKNVSYLGIDSSEKLIELAHQKWMFPSHSSVQDQNHTKMLGRAKVCGFQYPQFEVCDILAMQYHQQFDLVLCIRVLPHIPSHALRQHAVQNLYNALKPGGTLVLTAWNLWQPRFWWAHLRCLITQIFDASDLDFSDLLIPWKGSAAPRVQAYRYYHAFTLRELRKLLQNSGFKNQQTYYGQKNERKHWWEGNNMVVVAKKN